MKTPADLDLVEYGLKIARALIDLNLESMTTSYGEFYIDSINVRFQGAADSDAFPLRIEVNEVDGSLGIVLE